MLYSDTGLWDGMWSSLVETWKTRPWFRIYNFYNFYKILVFYILADVIFWRVQFWHFHERHQINQNKTKLDEKKILRISSKYAKISEFGLHLVLFQNIIGNFLYWRVFSFGWLCQELQIMVSELKLIATNLCWRNSLLTCKLHPA
jgi:hypothetical protein